MTSVRRAATSVLYCSSLCRPFQRFYEILSLDWATSKDSVGHCDFCLFQLLFCIMVTNKLFFNFILPTLIARKMFSFDESTTFATLYYLQFIAVGQFVLFFRAISIVFDIPCLFASCNCCGFCGKFVREWLKGSEKKTNAHCLQRKPQLYCIQICISNKFFFV